MNETKNQTNFEINQVINQPYKYGFQTQIEKETFPLGLNEEIITLLSEKKKEPKFLLAFRLNSYKKWLQMQSPDWANLKINPIDYPYSPPKVSFLTNDGKTRFHPNLYKNEKVCLSVLNTWKGEGWTSCQTILSILLILQSILDNKPLTHEPGMNETHKDFNTYNNIIKYKTIQVAIGNILEKIIYPEITELFWTEILENFKLNYDKIILNMNEEENTILETNIFNMNIIVNYSKIKSILTKNIN